jgi:predicted RNA-binding Zn ribbon-like protein
MTWPASGRRSGQFAPDGLGFVQDLLNTVSAGVRHPTADLLAGPGTAQAWLNSALTQWSAATGQAAHQLELTEPDLVELRSLRDELQRFVRREPDAETRQLTSSAGLQAGMDGQVRVRPRGTGWRRVASITLIEILEAQRTDRWRRLKLCRNRRCSAAFYDRSRNNSGVWHDVQQCGNAANLRAYRARRRTQATEANS